MWLTGTKQKPPFLWTEACREEKILFAVGRIVRLSLFSRRLFGGFYLSVDTAGHAFGVAAAACGFDDVEHHAGHNGEEVFHGDFGDYGFIGLSYIIHGEYYFVF